MTYKINIQTILFIICAALPTVFLFSWENYTLFNTALKHRILITWSEIFICFSFLLFRPHKIHVNFDYKLVIPLFLFATIGFISSVNSENPYAAIARQTEFCIHFLFIFILYKNIETPTHRNILIGGVIACFLYTVFHFLILRLAVGNIEYDWVSDIVFYANIRHWGYLQVLTLPLALFLLFSNNKRIKYLGCIILTLVWYSIIWSGGRGSFIAGLISYCIFIFIAANTKKNIIPISFATLILGLLMAYSLEGNNYSLSFKRLFFIDHIENQSSVNQISSSRLDIYKDSLSEVFNSHPMIGMGADNYRYSSNHESKAVPTHPHSLFIQLIYEYGLVGLILLTTVVIVLFTSLSKRNSITYKMSLLAVITCIIASSVDGLFYHSFSIFCISLIICVTLSSGTNKTDKTNNTLHSTTIISCSMLLLSIWILHTQTYYQYQKPLTENKQITTTFIFPSITDLTTWLHKHTNKEDLRLALRHSGKWSDAKCTSLKFLKYYYNEHNSDSLIKACKFDPFEPTYEKK